MARFTATSCCEALSLRDSLGLGAERGAALGALHCHFLLCGALPAGFAWLGDGAGAALARFPATSCLERSPCGIRLAWGRSGRGFGALPCHFLLEALSLRDSLGWVRRGRGFGALHCRFLLGALSLRDSLSLGAERARLWRASLPLPAWLGAGRAN
ncbi:hypothetical protein [Paenibacillus tuaregi]|uniref:hypothetical protein n=1 Tax=Paenibacillus tuaregi TaxID=1816681 RepID=UPI0008386BAC|nr:hypothetical protein [Paenibacillus tuaregi]